MYQIKDHYREMTQRSCQTSLQSKLINLRKLKTLIEEAIPDEQAAQTMYEKGEILANYAAMPDALKFKLIGQQERNHEIIFSEMLSQVKARIKITELSIECEQRKQV